MSQRYVLVLTAPNRVGILAAVTTALDELSGDLVEVNESVTQGFFTATIAAEFPAHRQAHVIIDHIRDVCRPFALEVSLRDLAQSESPAAIEETAQTFVLRVEGPDTPGVLRTLSTRLAEDQIDITDLHGIDRNGRTAFDLVIQLSVPGRVDLNELGSDLEALARSLGVTSTLELLSQPELGITTRTAPWTLAMTH